MDKTGQKPDYSLLPWDALEEVVKVFQFGAKKHSRDGWKDIPDAVQIYHQASARHLAELFKGNGIDNESGLHHEAHLAADALIALAHKIAAEKTITPK